jgi:alpha-beta hydrolase superfamily lysophospholipase
VDDFEALCDYAQGDLQQRAQASSSPPPPMFLGGQSLGGLVAPLACLRGPQRWAGLLLLSPALDVEWSPLLRWVPPPRTPPPLASAFRTSTRNPGTVFNALF